MDNNIANIEYNLQLIIDEIKEFTELIKNQDDGMIGIYKFVLYKKSNGISIKALINESLIETLTPLRVLIESILEEIIDMYDLYNLSLDMDKEDMIELCSLHLNVKEEKRFRILIVLNPDYIRFFDEDKFKNNQKLDTCIIRFNEIFNKMILDTYDLCDKLNIPINKIIKKSEEYELIFIKNKEDKWIYHTFIRTMIKSLKEQKKDIQNIIHSEEFYKIKQLLNEVTYDKYGEKCSIKLKYDGENISDILYNIN